MSKHTSPPPSYDEALTYLDGLFSAPLSARLVIHPAGEPHKVYAGAELIYTHQSGLYSVVRRSGEKVAATNAAAIQGACFRSAFRLRQDLGEVSTADIVLLHLWNHDLKP